jgi:hypothetical protein
MLLIFARKDSGGSFGIPFWKELFDGRFEEICNGFFGPGNRSGPDMGKRVRVHSHRICKLPESNALAVKFSLD